MTLYSTTRSYLSFLMMLPYCCHDNVIVIVIALSSSGRGERDGRRLGHARAAGLARAADLGVRGPRQPLVRTPGRPHGA